MRSSWSPVEGTKLLRGLEHLPGELGNAGMPCVCVRGLHKAHPGVAGCMQSLAKR